MNTKEEYISTIKDLIDTFFDGLQIKFAQFIQISPPTLSRVLNGGNISEDFQNTLYNNILNLDGIPIEIVETLQPQNFEQMPEISIDKRQQLLFNISRQIRHNDLSQITPKNKDSIFKIYEALYKIIEELQYSMGGLNSYYQLNSEIETQLYQVRFCLVDYCLSHKFFKVPDNELLAELVYYDISSISKYDKTDKNDNLIKICVPHDLLYPFLNNREFINIKRATEIRKEDINKIGLFTCGGNIEFLAKIKKPDRTPYAENYNFELIVNTNPKKYRIIKEDEVRKNNIKLLGIVENNKHNNKIFSNEDDGLY